MRPDCQCGKYFVTLRALMCQSERLNEEISSVYLLRPVDLYMSANSLSEP